MIVLKTVSFNFSGFVIFLRARSIFKSNALVTFMFLFWICFYLTAKCVALFVHNISLYKSKLRKNCVGCQNRDGSGQQQFIKFRYHTLKKLIFTFKPKLCYYLNSL